MGSDAFRDVLGESFGQGVAELFGEADEGVELALAVFGFRVTDARDGLCFNQDFCSMDQDRSRGAPVGFRGCLREHPSHENGIQNTWTQLD